MSDFVEILINPRRWWPIKRRVHSSQSEGISVQRTRTSAEVAEWCKCEFSDEEKAVKHYMRIERRLHRLPMQLAGEFHMTPVRWHEPRTAIGDFLFRKWFRS